MSTQGERKKSWKKPVSSVKPNEKYTKGRLYFVHNGKRRGITEEVLIMEIKAPSMKKD